MKNSYKIIFRKLFRIPPFVNPKSYFVELNILSYDEIIRKRMHSLLTRLQSSQNCIIKRSMTCESIANSWILARYKELLFPCPPDAVFPV